MSKKSKKEKGSKQFPQQIYVTIDKNGEWKYLNAGTHPTELLSDTGEVETIGTYEFVEKSKAKLTTTIEYL